MKPRFLLRDANIAKLALCKVGANQQSIFLLKSGEDETAVAAVAQLIKEPGDDWRTAYVPVAVPGAEENPGMFGDPDSVDVWESPQEIAKAAHSFMANGAKVVAKHFEDETPDGVHLAESAVALTDLKVGDALIKEGTWYVGMNFDADSPARELVSKGEIDAVSVEGLAKRIAKTGDDDQTWLEAREWVAAGDDPPACADCLAKQLDEALDVLAKDAALVPNKPGVTNWVERTGGLPKYIADIAGDLITERGKSTSQAIQLAIGIVKNWCEGKGNVKPDTRAKACAAVADWERKKAQAHLAKTATDPTMWERICKAFGFGDDDVPSLPENPGSVLDVDEAAITKRFEDIETKVAAMPAEIAKSLTEGDDAPLAKLSASVEALAKRIPDPEKPADEKPSIEKIVEAVESIAKSQGEQDEKLIAVVKAVEELGEGESSQTAVEQLAELLAKNNGNGGGGDDDSKFAGILSEA